MTVAGQETLEPPCDFLPVRHHPLALKKKARMDSLALMTVKVKLAVLIPCPHLGKQVAIVFQGSLKKGHDDVFFYSLPFDFGIPQTYQIGKLSFVTARIHEIMGMNVTK